VTIDRVEQIVRAVLYEGYVLYPYRPSALKNQKRFAFGAVYPRAWAERCGEPWTMRAECLFEGGREVAISVRFLVLHRDRAATEHAIPLDPRALAPAAWHQRVEAPLSVSLAVAIVPAGTDLWRVSVEIENLTPIDASADREAAMDVTLASTHTIVRVIGGAAVSTVDPPAHAAAAAASCRTLGCYPVVVATDTVLASPIVLPDFPMIAETSPGDFFDGTEIDEMLTLRILTMTDAEKAEAIAADPKVAELIRRTERLGIEETARLHGSNRVVGPRAGARVRLRPTRRADAFDVILAGKVGTITQVERDLDGRVHCAVILDDDPGADLGERGMPGHRFFFQPDELEVIA
jgi:hypothetical protein